MKPSIIYHKNRAKIRALVLSHNALNPRVFGSVLHGTDTERSDIDILVDTTPETSLFDIGAIHVELTELLGVKVDVLTPNALPERWKQQVLKEAQAV